MHAIKYFLLIMLVLSGCNTALTIMDPTDKKPSVGDGVEAVKSDIEIIEKIKDEREERRKEQEIRDFNKEIECDFYEENKVCDSSLGCRCEKK